MVSIRIWFEVSSPTGEGMQRLPVLPGELMVGGIDQIFAATIEEIKVNGKTDEVQAVRYTGPRQSIRVRLCGATNDLTNRAVKTLVVDIVE